MTTYLFRMDDICPTMSRVQFAKFERLFKHYGVRPLLGIVPSNMDPHLDVNEADPDFWPRMRSLASDWGWSIAQHGYTHVYESRSGGLLNINQSSEFAGLSYERQVEKLVRGAEVMKREGLATDIFMAPSHSYDQLTLDALASTGFKYVTDGYSFYPYSYRGLRFIPCQTGSSRAFPFGVVTVCIHANTSDSVYLDRLERFLIANKSSILPFSAIYAMKFGGRIQAFSEIGNLTLRRLVKRLG